MCTCASLRCSRAGRGPPASTSTPSRAVATRAASFGGDGAGGGARTSPGEFSWPPKTASASSGAGYRRGGGAARAPVPASGPSPGTRETLTGEVTIVTFQSEARPSRAASLHRRVQRNPMAPASTARPPRASCVVRRALPRAIRCSHAHLCAQESGYTVAKLRVEPGAASGAGASARGKARTIAVVGAMPHLAKGRRVCVEGEWVMDKKYGAQLKARPSRAHTHTRTHACTHACTHSRHRLTCLCVR
jgi:hypothetical protein